MNQTTLDSLNCPNCGAPLNFIRDQTTTQCAFCGAHIERTVPTQPPHPTAPQIEIPQLIVTTLPVEDQRRRGRATCLMFLFITMVTLVVAGLAMLNMDQVGHVVDALLSGDTDAALTAVPMLNKRIRVGESAALMPPREDAPPDLVALTMQYSSSGGGQEHRLVVLSSKEPKMRWQSAPLGEDVYRVPLVASEEMVYTLHDMDLMALHRRDGSLAWEAKIPDVVSSHLCRDCVRLVDGHIFTLSDDGTLFATDARTGEPVWDFRATQDSPRGLYEFDGRVAFIDHDENNDGLLRVFAPLFGEMETLQPVCALDSRPDHADWTTPLYPAPDGDGFYITLGFADVCVQRWDVSTMTQRWSTAVPDEFRDANMMVADQAVYIGSDGMLGTLDAETGALRTLVADEEYEFVPLTVTNGDVLVRATRKRGSKRFEIWSVKDEGSVNWTFDLGNNPPLDPPDAAHSIIDEDAPVWTWHLLPNGDLMIVRFKRAADDVSHALIVETINWRTGVSSGPEEIKLGISTTILSTPDFIIRRDTKLWMSIEGELLGFNTAAGEITYRWP